MRPWIQIQNIVQPEVFSQANTDLYFLQIANIDTHTCLDFLKCDQICVFDDNRILKTLEKIWTGMRVQICVLKKMKIWTHFKKSEKLCVFRFTI